MKGKETKEKSYIYVVKEVRIDKNVGIITYLLIDCKNKKR